MPLHAPFVSNWLRLTFAFALDDHRGRAMDIGSTFMRLIWRSGEKLLYSPCIGGELGRVMKIFSHLSVSVVIGILLTGGAAAGEREGVTPAAEMQGTSAGLGYAVSGSKGMRLSRFVDPSAARTAEETGVPDAFIPTPPGVTGQSEMTITGASGTGTFADTRSAGMPMLGARGAMLDPVVRVLPDPRPLNSPPAVAMPAEASAAAPGRDSSQPVRRKPLRIAGAEPTAPLLKRPMPIVIGAFR